MNPLYIDSTHARGSIISSIFQSSSATSLVSNRRIALLRNGFVVEERTRCQGDIDTYVRLGCDFICTSMLLIFMDIYMTFVLTYMLFESLLNVLVEGARC